MTWSGDCYSFVTAAGTAYLSNFGRRDLGLPCEAMARALFPSVTRHDFVGELRVPTAGPIADYVRSTYGTSQHADAERIAAEVLAAFPRSADGHCVITSHAGCLICQTG